MLFFYFVATESRKKDFNVFFNEFISYRPPRQAEIKENTTNEFPFFYFWWHSGWQIPKQIGITPFINLQRAGPLMA